MLSERAPRRSPRFTNASSAASQHSQPTPSERQRRNQTQPHEPVQRTGSPSTSVAQAQSTSDSTHGQQRPTLIHRTYAVPHRTYRSESMASLSTIVSTSSKGLPTIAEILAEIRATADARRRTEDEERGRVALEQVRTTLSVGMDVTSLLTHTLLILDGASREGQRDVRHLRRLYA
jgi:hypothetical protein